MTHEITAPVPLPVPDPSRVPVAVRRYRAELAYQINLILLPILHAKSSVLPPETLQEIETFLLDAESCFDERLRHEQAYRLASKLVPDDNLRSNETLFSVAGFLAKANVTKLILLRRAADDVLRGRNQQEPSPAPTAPAPAPRVTSISYEEIIARNNAICGAYGFPYF